MSEGGGGEEDKTILRTEESLVRTLRQERVSPLNGTKSGSVRLESSK